MNFLLVMPKSLGTIDHFNIFPIGLAYVSASMKRAGFAVFTANLDYLEGDTAALVRGLLTEHAIDVICTGGLSRDCAKLKEVIDAARAVNPRIITVVGGGIISSDPEPAMRVLNADIGVIGEGEVTMCELARALENDQPIDAVAGLIYRDAANSLVITAPRAEIADLDGIPFPDFDGFGYGRWVASSGSGLVLTDRSCPFRCTFCFHPTGEKYRQRSFDSIFAEIDHQVRQYGVTCLGLSSELFATSHQRVAEFCKRIKGYNLSWSCCLRVCDVDAEMLRLMKESGCLNVVFGLESADNSILKSMRKGITVRQIEEALELTYAARLMIEGGFIFGDINECRETVANTLAFWQRHTGRHYLNLSMISVFPGSFLYSHACDNGLIGDREQFLRDGCPLVNVSRLDATEYHALRSKVAELRFHPHVPAGSFEIESIRPDGECRIDYACRACATHSDTRVPFWFGQEVRCPACGLTNFIDPFQKALHNQDAFLAALPTDGEIALWGAGGIFYKLFQKYDLLAAQRFLLVDVNPAQQGLSICGKEVQAADVIVRKRIETVIITALSRKAEIHATLTATFPSVRRILVPTFDITPEGVVPRLRTVEPT
ncbi:MAG: cobalamin B12-binding domain-containing protein [Desulfuromonadales bacterium]|nr:cobalamin B12-binding domain-containing protein [Desulfuromonadales bacterium]